MSNDIPLGFSKVEAMALPPFGFRRVQLIASTLMIGAGITSLAVVLMDGEVALATSVLGEPFPDWFFARPGRGWLVLQAVLVIVGVVSGLMLRLFSLVAIGILAGLVFVTPVGLLTIIPAFCLLVLVLTSLNNFEEFRPRWPGPGPPPPGPWR